MTFGDLLIRDKMRMSRFGLALGSFLWGVQLLAPVQLFPTAAQIASGTGRTTYAYMAMLAPESIWGFLFLVHSAWAFYAVITGVRNHVTLAGDAFLGCLLWTTSTVACYAAHWPRGLDLWSALAAYPMPAAMSSDLVLSFFAWWHMIRMWAEEEGFFAKHTSTKRGQNDCNRC